MGWLPKCCCCKSCEDGLLPEVIRASVTVTGSNPPGVGTNCCTLVDGDYDLAYDAQYGPADNPTKECYQQWLLTGLDTDCAVACGLYGWRLRIYCFPSIWQQSGPGGPWEWSTPYWRMMLRPTFSDFNFTDVTFYFKSADYLYTIPDCYNLSSYALSFVTQSQDWWTCPRVGPTTGCDPTGGTAALTANP